MKDLIELKTPTMYDNKCKVYDCIQFTLNDSYYMALVDISGKLKIVEILSINNIPFK